MAHEGLTAADKVPYDVRLMVARLFNVALDPTSAPGFVSRIQATFAVPAPQPKLRGNGRVTTNTTTSAATRIERGLNGQ